MNQARELKIVDNCARYIRNYTDKSTLFRVCTDTPMYLIRMVASTRARRGYAEITYQDSEHPFDCQGNQIESSSIRSENS